MKIQRTTVEEGIYLLKSGEYIVHFRPNKDLPEEEQYCEVQKLSEVYEAK